jgi:hypothetical protein
MKRRSSIVYRYLILFVAAVLLCLSQGKVQAQYQWEFVPRLGEKRFNQFQYKAVHNSFQQTQSIEAQIDDYNAWTISLDIWDDHGVEILVGHNSPTDSGHSLQDYLEQINACETAREKFTFISLQLRRNDDFPWQGSVLEYRNRIKGVFTETLGAEHIFTFEEFAKTDGDNGRWPSMQELVRRGKYFAVVLLDTYNDNDSVSEGFNEFFFSYHGQAIMPGNSSYFDAAPHFNQPYKIVFLWSWRPSLNNINDMPYPENRGDRFLSRLSTDTECGEQEDANYWDKGITHGYNFIGTDCVDASYTVTDAHTHSPSPLHVRIGDSTHQWGTHRFPYTNASGLRAAVGRASPSITMKIEPGVYNATSSGANPLVIAKPMTLKIKRWTGGNDDVIIK